VNGRKEKAAQKFRDGNRILEIAAEVRNKAKAEKRFYCDDCEQPLATQSALDKHNASQAHADQLAGVIKSERSQRAIDVQAIRDAARAQKEHHCHTCDKGYGTDCDLKRHK